MDEPEKELSVCGYCQKIVTSYDHSAQMILEDHKAFLTHEVMIFQPCGCSVYGHISDYYAPEDEGEILVEITDPLTQTVVLRYLADPTLMGMEDDS